MDETRLNRTALVKCQFGVADTHPRPFRQLKRASLRYTGRLILMSHISTSPAIRKTSSETVYCLLSNICVEFRRSSRDIHCAGAAPNFEESPVLTKIDQFLDCRIIHHNFDRHCSFRRLELHQYASSF
jgi:hypothetical protein